MLGAQIVAPHQDCLSVLCVLRVKVFYEALGYTQPAKKNRLFGEGADEHSASFEIHHEVQHRLHQLGPNEQRLIVMICPRDFDQALF